jgi:hypothetical protein
LPGVVAHAFNPGTWEAETGRFLSSRPTYLVYKVSSRTARAIQRNPVSKKKKERKEGRKAGRQAGRPASQPRKPYLNGECYCPEKKKKKKKKSHLLILAIFLRFLINQFFFISKKYYIFYVVFSEHSEY